MKIHFSFEENSFLLPNGKTFYLFIIYEINMNKIISYRLGQKSPASLVDKSRTTYSAIKKLIPKGLNVITLNDEMLFFNLDQKLFIEKYKTKFVITNTDLIQNLIEFFLNHPFKIWNNTSYSTAITTTKKIKSKIVIDSFNSYLNEKQNKINKKETNIINYFLAFDFKNENSILQTPKYTLNRKKKEKAFLKSMDQLHFFQKEYIEKKLNSTLLLELYWGTLINLQIKIQSELDEFQNLNLTALPNEKEFLCILLNAGSSIKKNKEFYTSLLRIFYFYSYCLGLDLKDFFHLKKTDLLQIKTCEICEIVTFDLNSVLIKRTILPSTLQTFKYLDDDIKNVFQNNFFYTKKENLNISNKSFLTLVNKDLDFITETLKLDKFRSESLKISAIFNIREFFSKNYVISEFQISKSFIERVESCYEIKR